IMSEIAAASAEQSSGIEQVNQAVTQMDALTQQNAALVEEAAAAAESMQDQAVKLSQAVAVFKLAGAVGQPAVQVQPAAPAALRAPRPGRETAATPRPLAAGTARLPSASRASRTDGDDWEEF
ncbi:MAG: hypothetical protein ACM34A_05520, partial [Bacillota bacterium]